MAEHHSFEGSSTSNASAETSESSVELNIKTLDSQMYSFNVDKNIPVSMFKEEIAGKIGVPVGQQRLIFRGKVLKDNHLLSDYHVDNGHTLHLVVRQPSQPQPHSGTSTGEANTDTGTRGLDGSASGPHPRVGQVSHSVVLGTFNVGEQGEGVGPDISQVIGAVLNSFGIGNHTAVNGSGGLQPNMQFNALAQAPQGNETEGAQGSVGDQSQARNQPPQPRQMFPGQTIPQLLQFPLGASIPVPSLNNPIPDSLHTLSMFMNRMELALSQNGNQANQSLDNTGDLPHAEMPTDTRGLPTLETLGVVLRQAQHLLSDPTVAALSRISGLLEQEGGSADPAIRSQIQIESMQVGLAMQHLGSLLLELGRTMLTLRMGQSSAESSVYAGPAVYISPSGPNPIMVQPFPLQTSSLFSGSVAPPFNTGNFVPGAVGPIPRHVNIHIHTAVGPSATNGEGRQGDRANGTGSGDSGQARMLPVRNFVAAAAPSRPSAASIPSAAQPGFNVSQQSPNFEQLSTTMADINSQIRNFFTHRPSENQVPPGHPENSAVPDQSMVSGAGNEERNNDVRSLVGSIGETSSHASETETNEAQSERVKLGSREDVEGAINANVPSSSSSAKKDDNQSSVEAINKSDDSRSNQGSDNTDGARTVPIGLGLGGLQPKRRSRPSRIQNINGVGVTSNTTSTDQNQNVRSDGQQVLRPLSLANRNANALASGQLPHAGGAIGEPSVEHGGQFDPASVMSQVLSSPALDGLLTGVSQQTGVGSPDALRNMLGQLTRSPAMMNTVNQIAQQIDGEDFGSMFGGSGSGGGGGIDLSRMIQQMMPIVSQALGGGSAMPQQGLNMEREIQPTHSERRENRDENPNDKKSQVDLQQVVQKLEHEDPPEEVFRSMVESVVLNDSGSGSEGLVNELCSEEGLASEYTEMLYRDIIRRLHNETGSGEES